MREKLKNSDNPILQTFGKGEASEELKLKVIKGVLPLEAPEYAKLYYLLGKDPSTKIRTGLKNTFEEFSDEKIQSMIQPDDMESSVLNFFAVVCQNRPAVLEDIIRHPNVNDETIVTLAGRVNEDLLELILVNQDRLIREPDIINEMFENKSVSKAIESRLIEITKEHIEKTDPESLESEPEDELPEEEQLEESPEESEEEEPSEPEEEEVQETEKEESAEEEDEDEDLTTYQKIQKMSVSEKIVLGLKGNKEERSYLIKDPKNVVARSVLNSPKVQEGEVEQYAKMKNLSKEVFQKISRNREWMENYSVVHNLVRNPRAPVGVARAQVHRLKKRDLRNIVDNRNVPQSVRKVAKKELRKRSSSR